MTNLRVSHNENHNKNNFIECTKLNIRSSWYKIIYES